FEEAVCVIVKHGNPCGVGRHKSDILKAYQRALESDPVSAFGGVVIVNREVSGLLAEEMNKIFLEVVLAPAYEKEALPVLEKKKNLRILTLPFQPLSAMENSGIEQLDLKKITGGVIAHRRDLETINAKQWKVVCGEKPSANIQKALEFAWKVVKHVKSNAIV
ncbi:MAG: bifunctional phosphoribosylaminoimidazolecarboxamide formyltransferase/IMP cyclohydrolase, partial [Deltaproteobacteria bacterium]